MQNMKHRKSQKEIKAYFEHLKRAREIEKLKKEILAKKKERADRVTEAWNKKREEVIKQNQILIQEREERRKRLSKELELKIKEFEKQQKKKALIATKENKKLERQEVRQERKEAIQLKVISAKKSFLKKVSETKDSLTKVKNLKIFKAKKTMLIIAMLGLGGFTLYKTNLIQDAITNYRTEKALEDLKNDSSSISSSNDVAEEPSSDDIESTIPEEVVEEKHETVNTDLYDSGYEFNEEITPEYLQTINPELSDDTVWFTIPGTRIDFPIVHPSTENIDNVDGLRDDVKKTGYDDERYMNEYYLHHTLTNDYSKRGTAYVDLHNNQLTNHTDELSDMTVIYGHTMKDGSQFTDVGKWTYDADQSYNEEHPYGIIYTSDGLGYKVTWVTSRIISGEDSSILHTENFESYEDKNEYIQGIIQDAKDNGWFTLDEYEVKEDDKFICLTKCTYEFKNARYQLIGVLEKIKINDYENNDGYYVEESSTRHR